MTTKYKADVLKAMGRITLENGYTIRDRDRLGNRQVSPFRHGEYIIIHSGTGEIVGAAYTANDAVKMAYNIKF